ncbi:phosphatase PAP2 family protein [Nocardioides sp. SR21]|uniref:phosphatase PAP2 family protein n=1 Tax=Nocardioides sp. SR21 TaxID=2919501 RepID=UPI001FAA4046|nr:phosphatase PAP2 family protein [Nocardioides sp. SR21]
MPWPTWDQAAVAALLSCAVWLGLRRWRPGTRNAEPLAREFALIAALYALWRLARMLPLATTSGALARGREIDHVERALHLPSELALQNFVLDHAWVGEASTWYYATVHVPALIAFLVWLFMRHRDQFPHWRNGLALLTLGCLIIRFVRVAPPRFFPDLGYENVSHFYGMSVYTSDVQEGVSDQFAAMPSIHVGWAAVVSLGIVAVSTSVWRWVFLLHVILTTLVVSATANHWWLDGVVAVGLLLLGLAIDTGVRRWFAGRRRAAEPVTAFEAATVATTRS